MISHNTNLLRIRIVAEALQELKDSVVFVGGATVSLYTDWKRHIQEDPRSTDDVDIVVEVTSGPKYAILEEKLREKGFKPDPRGGVICRYNLSGLQVDIMPTDEAALGFSNRWYPKGFETSILVEIQDGLTIRIFSIFYFLASKFEALLSRGGGTDYRSSSDFADIAFVLGYGLYTENQILEEPLRTFIHNQFRALLKRNNIEEELETAFDSPLGIKMRDIALQRIDEILHT